MKAVVAAFNQEKAVVGAFSGITNLRMDLFEALVQEPQHPHRRVDGQELQPARPPPVPVRMVRTTLFKDLLNKYLCSASIQTIKHLQYLLSKLKVESCKE